MERERESSSLKFASSLRDRERKLFLNSGIRVGSHFSLVHSHSQPTFSCDRASLSGGNRREKAVFPHSVRAAHSPVLPVSTNCRKLKKIKWSSKLNEGTKSSLETTYLNIQTTFATRVCNSYCILHASGSFHASSITTTWNIFLSILTKINFL